MSRLAGWRGLAFLAGAEAVVIGVLVLLLPGGGSRVAPPVPDPDPVESGPGRAAGPARIAAAPGQGGGGPGKVPDPRRRMAPTTPGKEGGTLLFGRITDRGNHPVEGGRLTLVGGKKEGRATHHRVEPGKGVWAQLILDPGRWRIQYRQKGWSRVEREVVLDGSRAMHRLDLRVARTGVLKVKFLDREGKPLRIQERILFPPAVSGSHFYAIATRALPPENLPLPHGIRHNEYACGLWHPVQDQPYHLFSKPDHHGEIELLEPPPLFVSAVLRSAVLATRPVAPGQEEVVFRLDPEEVLARGARVKLKLIDSTTGEPLDKAKLWIRCRGAACTRKIELENGCYRTRPIPPGITRFSLYSPARAGWSRYLHLQPGQDVDLGVIRLQPFSSIEGRVLDSRGRPVQAALAIGQASRGDTPRPRLTGLGRRTDGEGRFQRVTGPGRRLLRAFYENKEKERVEIGAALVEVGREPVRGITLRTAPATRVVLHNRSKKAGPCTFTLLGPDGTPLWADLVDRNRKKKTWLRPGNYTLEIHRGLELRAQIPLAVTRHPAEVHWP